MDYPTSMVKVTASSRKATLPSPTSVCVVCVYLQCFNENYLFILPRQSWKLSWLLLSDFRFFGCCDQWLIDQISCKIARQVSRADSVVRFVYSNDSSSLLITSVRKDRGEKDAQISLLLPRPLPVPNPTSTLRPKHPSILASPGDVGERNETFMILNVQDISATSHIV